MLLDDGLWNWDRIERILITFFFFSFTVYFGFLFGFGVCLCKHSIETETWLQRGMVFSPYIVEHYLRLSVPMLESLSSSICK